MMASGAPKNQRAMGVNPAAIPKRRSPSKEVRSFR
jgi:hypothetical protein